MKKLTIIIFVILLTRIASLNAQNIDITFKVNMSYMIEQGKFNPATEFLDIAGTFNGWGANDRLNDGDEDGIYEITLSGFTSGETISFKCRINGDWNGREEFPYGGPDRMYKVQDGENTAEFWYNDDLPPGSEPVAKLQTIGNEVFEEALVEFRNVSVGEFNDVQWIFEGGEPNMSNSSNPLVYYEYTGSFNVTLIVGNGSVSDTLFLSDYIRVEERDRNELDWWNDAVFYELFVRSFKDSDGDGIGDFQGIIEKLDYLNDGDPDTDDDLGITGIWLMPINPSPSYHGYDVTDYRGIHPDYGTMEDFQEFLDAAHERGIRVIIDFVMNHTSEQHPWFRNSSSNSGAEKRNWYRWNSINPGTMGWHQASTGYYYGYFWSGMPDLNYETESVKTEMFDIADYWLSEVGIDGFRLDAVKYIFEEGDSPENTPATYQFWKEYQQEIKNINPEAFSVGEAWTSTDQVLNYVKDGALDYCFEFDLAFRIIDAVNDQNVNNLIRQVQKSFNVYPHLQFGTFLTNHDMERVMNVLGNSKEKVKTAASIYLSLPGVPYIYYGEEIGMLGMKPDEYIRAPMQWNSDSGGGFTSGVPWENLNVNYTEVNVDNQAADPNSILNHYRKMIRIRNENIALRQGDFYQASSSDSRVLAFERACADQALLIAISLTDANLNNVSIDLSYTNLKPSSILIEDIFNETEAQIDISENKIISGLSFMPREVKILNLSETVPVELLTDDLTEAIIFPNPTKEYLILDLPGIVQSRLAFAIFNICGQKMMHGTYQTGERLNIRQLPDGIYVLEISDIEKRIIVKFIVLH